MTGVQTCALPICCERFRLLSEGLEDENLRAFYHEFMISEAGHYVLFIELANTYIDKEKVKVRWQEWLNFEATVINGLKITGERIH